MRNFAIVLGCLAWILSCYDAVSYFRAGEQEHLVTARLQTATGAAASTESTANQDTAHIQQRLRRDEQAVAEDGRALDRAQKSGVGEAQAKQTLAADQAALQADRMMQYTVENFARADPDPRVVAAENRVDTDERLLAEIAATKRRDHTLAHFLIALWALAAGTAFLAFRRVHGEALSEDTDDGESESTPADTTAHTPADLRGVDR